MSNTLFRQVLWVKLAAGAGILTKLVQNNLPPNAMNPRKSSDSLGSTSTNFREQFLKTPPGAEREALILRELVHRGPPKNLVPVTIDGPNGTKITYKTMPDFVMIDGLRITMAPATAQKVADAYGMFLPTDKMSQQIYHAADTKVRAIPLSSSGYIGSDGKYYDGKQVANNRINQSDAAEEYNLLTNKEIEKLKQTGKIPVLLSGHGKEFIQPLNNPKDVSFGGWAGTDGHPLQPYSSAHKGTANIHSEYGLYTRLIDNQVIVTNPDGSKTTTTLDKVLSDPNLGKSLSNKPGSIARY